LRKAHVAMDSPRVLIVEDFEDLRNLVAFFLGARGYQVLEAGNGRAAIQTALNGKPNFILLDLRLPDIDGLEVARELRNSPATEHIPIVGWSADFPSNPQRERLRFAGIIDYIQKPISLRALDALIEQFLPNSKQQN
jgi:CheY-like chemotaxis protein